MSPLYIVAFGSREMLVDVCHSATCKHVLAWASSCEAAWYKHAIKLR